MIESIENTGIDALITYSLIKRFSHCEEARRSFWRRRTTRQSMYFYISSLKLLKKVLEYMDCRVAYAPRNDVITE